MIHMKVALLVATAMMTAQASAQTWDAHGSFSLDANEDASSPFRYTVGGRLATQKNASCMEEQGDCIIDAEVAFAGVYKPRVNGEWLTIGLDASMLFLHPAYFEPTAVVFTAPREGTYRLTGGFRIIDHYPTGVTVSWGEGQKLLSEPGQSTSFSYEKHLEPGQSVAFAVDPNGDYGFDSTGVAVQATFLGSDAPVWQTGGWGDWSTTCGEATRTRTVTCVGPRTGSTLSDSSCEADARPQASETSAQTSGCTFSWKAETWGATVPACGMTVQNRTVRCERSDGQAAGDASCPSETRPDDRRDVADFSACGFSWEAGAWTDPTRTCGSSTRTREVLCRRSDGAVAGDASCTATRPEASETVADYSVCTASWRYSDWSAPVPACGETVSTRTAECVRQDGVTVASASCGAQEALERPATDYGACTFSWQTGGWTTPAACGTTTRTRTVSCLRGDGSPSADDRCDAGSRPVSSERVTDTTGCRYDWVQTGIGAWSACQAGRQTRAIEVQCRRSDGSAAADSLCTGARPASNETRTCGDVPPPRPGQEGDVVIFRRQMQAGR